jgi:hypothetical protein
LASLGVGIDCLLLAVMLITAPCASCLVAAALLALIYACFRALALDNMPSRHRNHSLLLLSWLCLFVANLGVLAHITFTPWPIYAAENKDQFVANVYFSPSCPACRQLVQHIDQAEAARMNWYPVAENEDDISVIAALHEQIRQGKTMRQAFNSIYDAPQLDPTRMLLSPEILILQIRLFINHAHVLRSEGILPLIEYQGAPAFLIPKPHTPPPGVGQSRNLPISPDLLRCTSSEDCPE